MPHCFGQIVSSIKWMDSVTWILVLRKFDAFGTRRTLIRLKCFDWWGKGPPFLYWPRTKQICMHFGTRRLPWISLRNLDIWLIAVGNVIETLRSKLGQDTLRIPQAAGPHSMRSAFPVLRSRTENLSQAVRFKEDELSVRKHLKVGKLGLLLQTVVIVLLFSRDADACFQFLQLPSKIKTLNT